jgi:GTPase SAR1 family protein
MGNATPKEETAAEAPVIVCNVVLFGNSQVGKTSIYRRFLLSRLPGHPPPTKSVDVGYKQMILEHGELLQIVVWDTPPTDLSNMDLYAKDVDACFFVADTTEPRTFRYMRCIHPHSSDIFSPD